MIADRTEYQREYHRAYQRKDNRAEYFREYRKSRDIPVRNFIACDGEGYSPSTARMPHDLFGAGYNVRQEYGLLRIGEDLLYTGRPLKSLDCLEFIVSRNPRAGIYIGYYFDYDCTMILRDLPEHIIRRILAGFYTVYENYVIKYIPKQFISVGLADKSGQTIKYSSVTINDVGAFFQCKFTNALAQWSAASENIIARIQTGKDKRGTETCVDDEMIEYNALECDYLAELMDRFSSVVKQLDIVPAQWRGPGWIAARALKNNRVPKRVDIEKLLSDDLRMYAPLAYYGGRFETPMIGDIGEAYAYDLNSAYPAAMQYLPCLKCCQIVKFGADEKTISPHTLAYIEFDHPDDNQRLCGIPIRSDNGILYWPRRGSGWYWGVEILAAMEAGMTIKIIRGWHIVSGCAHTPFDFVNDLYLERKRVGKDAKGIALKLAYNSIYGKLVQRIGTRPYYNPIWAGLVTAYVRAWLIRAYIGRENDIAMIATDALYTRQSMRYIPISDNLGEWSEQHTEDLFIVQPGIYDARGRAVKTRGVDKQILSEVMDEFRDVWRKYMQVKGGPLPSNQVLVHGFIGLKLAYAWNKPWIAGSWNDAPRKINFDWTVKRRDEPEFMAGEYVMTWPKLGDTATQSRVNDQTLVDMRAELDILRYAHPDDAFVKSA